MPPLRLTVLCECRGSFTKRLCLLTDEGGAAHRKCQVRKGLCWPKVARAVAGAGVCRRRIVEEVMCGPGLRDGWAWGAERGARAGRAVQLGRGEGAPQPGTSQNGRRRFPQTHLGRPPHFSVAMWPWTRPHPTRVILTCLGPGLELVPLFGLSPFSGLTRCPPRPSTRVAWQPSLVPGPALCPAPASPAAGPLGPRPPGQVRLTAEAGVNGEVCTLQSALRGRHSECGGGAPREVEGEAR